MVTNAKEIAQVVQICNEQVIMLHNKETSNVSRRGNEGVLTTLGNSGAIASTSLETGCVVCIKVCLQLLLGALKLSSKRKLRPCVTSQQLRAVRVKRYLWPSLLCQAEQVIDQLLVANCSSCCPNKDLTIPTSRDATTVGGGQPLNKKSARCVYLNETTCVLQEGVYYRHYFVPKESGNEIGWFSSLADAPKQKSARVCCLLNAINAFTGDGNGVIKQFSVLTKPPTEDNIGPLGIRCMKQVELEEPGPVLVMVTL